MPKDEKWDVKTFTEDESNEIAGSISSILGTQKWYGPDLSCLCEGWKNGHPVFHEISTDGHKISCTSCRIETTLHETEDAAKAEWASLQVERRS